MQAPSHQTNSCGRGRGIQTCDVVVLIGLESFVSQREDHMMWCLGDDQGMG